MEKKAEAAMEKEIKELVSLLSLEEKIAMIHGAGLFRTAGVERLGIPDLKMSDGPMGVRNEFQNEEWITIGNSDDYVTYLPSNSALAATWNRQLAYETGKVLGEEARGRGKDMILAPGINIKRSPLCGRNFEYMSEDPYLTGEMAVPLIQGIQTADEAACVKHFALNSQETERFWVNVAVSERALREIYLPAFKKAVEEGNAYSLMGAYNQYKNEHCCESKELLNGILRTEWGYDGVVVSDWGGVHKTKEAAESGLDIEMSVENNFDEYCMASPLKAAVEAGEIQETLLDTKVEHILKLMFRLHMLGDEERKTGCYNTTEHREKTLAAARESVILLKNEAGMLPMSPKKIRRLLVIGDNASRVHSNGGGSAEIKALYEISPLMGIKKRLGGNTQVDYVQGYFVHDLENVGGDVNWQANSLENGGGSITAAGEDEEIIRRQVALRHEAVERAADSSYDAVIFIGGQNHQQDTEGHDRPDMRLPYAQDELIRELLGVCPDLMVIMVSGSAVEMPWLSEVKSLVWHWYAGMEGGTALAEVLFGDVNPSGRLPESFPITHMDCPAHCVGEFPGDKNVRYDEGIFVGYRYYDTKKKKVLFPFGYGLSYTEFTFSDMVIMGNYPEIKVCVDVTNTGSRSGQEIVQLYVGKKDSTVERAEKELKAFEKISLEPGQTKTVVLTLDEEAFNYYNEEKHAFDVESGEYQIYIGKSVENICLEGKCTI